MYTSKYINIHQYIYILYIYKHIICAPRGPTSTWRPQRLQPRLDLGKVLRPAGMDWTRYKSILLNTNRPIQQSLTQVSDKRQHSMLGHSSNLRDRLPVAPVVTQSPSAPPEVTALIQQQVQAVSAQGVGVVLRKAGLDGVARVGQDWAHPHASRRMRADHPRPPGISYWPISY